MTVNDLADELDAHAEQIALTVQRKRDRHKALFEEACALEPEIAALGRLLGSLQAAAADLRSGGKRRNEDDRLAGGGRSDG